MSDTIRMPGGGWRLWPHFALRGPGFPAAGVLRLAPEGLAAAADKFTPGETPAAADWEAFEETFTAAAVQTARDLQEIAASAPFRAAVAWQNRAVLGTGIKSFLDWTPSAEGRTSMPRQREELVAHYWQRFCVKNDTIGFFGPVGWGTFDTARRGVDVHPGTGLVADSRVYFSSWSMDALAKAIDRDPRVRAWTPPRPVPFVRAAEGTVHLPGRPPQPAAEPALTVFRLCDGRRTPAEITELAARELGRPLPAAEVTAALEWLVARRLVLWRLDVPAGTYPEQELRAMLERIGDADVREPALARLAVLEQGRDRVQRAGTDPEELTAALAALEADFAGITEVAAVREKGARTAPNRALVYSDTRRSATATVGTAVLEQLAPLELCMTAARWLTNRYAESVGARIHAAYLALRERAGGGPVDLGSLWFACLPAPHPESIADADRIQADLRERWRRIIDAPAGARRVTLASADIAEQVHEAFPDEGRGWSLSRYISPDLMIIAEDLGAVERGEFELVIGELHIAMNTLGQSLFVHQHPDREQLIDETTRDFPGPRLLPMLPKELPLKWSARSRQALSRPQDHYVALTDHTADPHRPRTVRSGDVLVEERDGRLAAVLPDGSAFELLDVFCHALTNRVMDRFTLRSDGDHSPRITIDSTVVARETWRFAGAALDFADEKTEARRFVRARQWRDAHELPRFVFVVSPTEPRPFFVDFDSPVYVTILAKAARRLARKDPDARLTVSEMLPTPEQAWLTDDQGRRYTSELRLVAVDRTTGTEEPA
ncbi:lantibiotic dehydratase [Kitasatospora sp. NPDC058218]|uniref:lantibiotic dehydratase n=1 Tax=Kitasatospora sp. NPDC058218 TaxID=3346385 RepID=UPI0036DF858C